MPSNPQRNHFRRICLLVIGPSTAGKTEVAFGLAKRLHGEIINADKFYLYSEFPSTTGLPDFSKHPTVSTHLYGILKPEQQCYSGAEYADHVCEIVEDIWSRGHLPIIEGCYHRFAKRVLHKVGREACLLAGIRWPKGTNVEPLARERVDYIFHDRGGIEEVRQALQKGYRGTYVMRKGSMVKPLVEYLDGKISLQIAKTKAVAEIVSAAYKAYRKFLDMSGIMWYENSRNRLPGLVESIAKRVRAVSGGSSSGHGRGG